jgi:hypothetical protein
LSASILMAAATVGSNAFCPVPSASSRPSSTCLFDGDGTGGKKSVVRETGFFLYFSHFCAHQNPVQ